MSHGVTLPRRPDGTPYLERTCATCFARITYTGQTAEVMSSDRSYSLCYCDHVCAPRFKWSPWEDSDTQRAREREIKARRIAVAEGRR